MHTRGYHSSKLKIITVVLFIQSQQQYSSKYSFRPNIAHSTFTENMKFICQQYKNKWPESRSFIKY